MYHIDCLHTYAIQLYYNLQDEINVFGGAYQEYQTWFFLYNLDFGLHNSDISLYCMNCEAFHVLSNSSQLKLLRFPTILQTRAPSWHQHCNQDYILLQGF